MCLKNTDLHPLRGSIAAVVGAKPAGAQPMASIALIGAAAATLPTAATANKRRDNAATADIAVGTPNGRRRLWDLPATFHCPLIGVCFGTDDVRQLLNRYVLVDGHDDYELHVLAVSECATRNETSRALMRVLDKRFSNAIKRYLKAIGADQIEVLWRNDIASGNAAGALWAALSHPACSKFLQGKIYGDIHLLQHEAAAQARVGIRLKVDEKRELLQLREEVASLRVGQQQTKETLGQQISQLREEKSALEVQNRVLCVQLEKVQIESRSFDEKVAEVVSSNDDADRSLQRAQRQIQKLRERLGTEVQKGAELTALLNEKKSAKIQAGLQGQEHSADQDKTLMGQHPFLTGQRVLCVGGRPSLIASYKTVVEQMGGRFAHHDGGAEQKIAKLNPSLNGADVVLCLAGCVSHDAYWRVKKHCRRSGKRCVYVESNGVQSLIRSLSTALIHDEVEPAQVAQAEQAEGH